MTKTRMIFLFSLALLWTASALPTEQFKPDLSRNNILEIQVLALLEDLREMMLTGSDGIPVLDPLHVEHFHVDENIVGIPGARLTINELLVKYASTFVVDRLSITLSSLILQQYAVAFEVHIPVLEAETGEYDLFLSAMGFDIFGRGDGKVKIVGPKVTGSFTFGVWTMTISNTVINFNLSGFEPALTGLFYDDGASAFANSFLRHLVPELIDFYEEDISAFLGPLVQDIANQILEDVSIGDLFPQFYRLQMLNQYTKMSVS